MRRLDRELPLVVTSLVLLVGAAGWALYHFGGESLPEMRENHFILHMQGIPGTSLPQSMAAGNAVSRELKKIPAVARRLSAGRAGPSWARTPGASSTARSEVGLKDLGAEEFEAAEQSLKATLRDKFPGFSFEVFSFLSERIQETISGSIAPVAVKVYGDDLADAGSGRPRRSPERSARVPGSDNVRPEPQTGQPELVIRVRPEDAARHNLRAAQILDAVHAAYQGAEVAQAYDRNRIINLVVILDPEHAERSRRGGQSLDLRTEPRFAGAGLRAQVADPWRRPDRSRRSRPGDRLQLKQVADVFLSDGRFLVRHEGGLRQQLVTCNVQGRDIESFVAEAERRVRKLALPAGGHLHLQRCPRDQAGGAARVAAAGLGRRGGHLADPLDGLRLAAAAAPDPGEPAVRPGGRRGGGLHDGRRPGRRLAGRVRDAVRHHDAQQHHDGVALAAPARGRGRALGPGADLPSARGSDWRRC